MELENETPYACAASRTQLVYRDLIQAIVVAKATFVVGDDGQVRLAERQRPVLEEDELTELGRLDSEIVPVKAGCDLAVLGQAHAPRDRPVQSMTVSLRIGQWRRDLAVFGDRIWKLGWDAPRPSRPRPFRVMPLTYERAFGGVTRQVNGGLGPWFENPEGRGYLVNKKDALGTFLPNVEDPAHLIQRWDDRPPVAGLGPLPRQSSLRVKRGIVVDVERQTTRLQPSAFTWAHPDLAQRRYPAGERVEMVGFRPGPPLSFTLPELAPVLRLKLGDLTHELPLTVDTLCLFPATAEVVVAGRFTFVYQFVPERKRTMRLALSPGLRLPTLVTTIAQQRRLRTATIPLELDVAPELSFLPVEQWLANNPLGEIVDRLPLFPSS
jgi:hypothetical protein